MSLSRVWQAGNFMKHAMATFPAIDDVAYAQRFELINFIQSRIASEFYGMMSLSYQTQVILQQDTAGRIGTGGSWTFATSTLVVSGLSSSFTVNDIGKLIVFTDGTNTYAGYVSVWMSTTTVQVTGNSLPGTDVPVLTSVILVPTNLNVDSVSLSGIDMMRTGEQTVMDLQSSASDAVEAVQVEEFRFFRQSSAQNRSRIVYALVGDRLALAKGSALSSYGTLIFTYPRAPIPVAQDTDYLDLPDGGIINLAMILLKKELNDRFYHLKMDYSTEANALIAEIFNNYKVVRTTQDIEAKKAVLL